MTRLFLAICAIVTASVLGLRLDRPAEKASALAPKLTLPQAVCSAGLANVTFSWTAVPGAFDQWLDLSLVDNNFEPGSFVAAGPLSASQETYTWTGLTPGAVYYWRVNARMDGGWATSVTGTFVPCSGPVLLWGPLSCDGDIASVHFRWAPGTLATVQYLDLGFDPDFAPGSFMAAGPLDPATQEYHWQGLQPGVTYFFRVNALGGDGVWRSTVVGGFSPSCEGAEPLNLELQGSNDRLVIARLAIDAPVNVRNVGPDGALGDPRGPWDVVRYNFPLFEGYGGYPGLGGTTVVAGHVDYRPNIMAIFWELRKAQPGDVIEYYRGDGAVVRYTVDWVQQVSGEIDMTPLSVSTDAERIVLVTCTGTFNPETRQYDLRFVVHATRTG